MDFRIATESDLDALAQMRWDFRLEESPGTPVHDRQTFLETCTAFLRQGLASQRWVYWVAVCDDTIVSHIFVQRIAKVPKPNRLDDGFGYVTNVYTRPAYRGRGIGSELMARVIAWAEAQDLECLLVGPSDASVRFYERAGFRWNEDLMEYTLRPYVA
ncbi:MAG: GNAT family N-acetyltransferase [Anaerolineae bacterium]|nr:GNAT family N-acetyltransferase [Anaerolineae bacterium]